MEGLNNLSRGNRSISCQSKINFHFQWKTVIPFSRRIFTLFSNFFLGIKRFQGNVWKKIVNFPFLSYRVTLNVNCVVILRLFNIHCMLIYYYLRLFNVNDSHFNVFCMLSFDYLTYFACHFMII